MSRALINKSPVAHAIMGLIVLGSLLVAGCSDDDAPQRTRYLADEAGRLYASDHVIAKAAAGEAFQTLVERVEARGWEIMESDQDQQLQDTLGYVRIWLPVGTTPEDALAYLSANELIESGTLNYQLEVLREPNDPYWDDTTSDLWGHRFVGVTDAWETTTGSASTLVALVDTGVDLTHADLVDNLVRSPDDANVVLGWDLVDGDTVPQDENGHGTHIAGVIGATGNNNLGSAGLNWNVGLLPIRVFDEEGQGSLWNAALGLLLAAEANAKVINASWGISINQPGPLLEAAQHAIDQGAILVTSAGNDGRDLSIINFFPANLLSNQENRAILAVGSLTKDGNPASTSNYGSAVDLWAPGRSIWSTLPGDTYGFEQGTSAAAAYVSGIAALYASVVPSATGVEIAAKLKETSNEAEFGQIVNVANALSEGLPPPVAAVITSVTPLPGASAEVTWDYPSAVRPDSFEVHWRIVDEPREEDACFLPQIYGADGRKDFYQVNQINPLATQLADATVALFMNPNFIQRDQTGTVSIYDRIIYGNYYNLCQSEPFWSQPIGSNCSGLLVGPDLVATAGHCIESQAACENITFAFGYRMDAADSPRTTLPADDVYGCAELVSQHYQGLPGHDYALVRLDREVVGHTPFPIQRDFNLENETPVVVAGHPKGLPWKYSDDARILSNQGQTYFLTSLDAYQGNSGSPVIREDTGEMVGILSFGTQANFWASGNCNVSPQCDDSVPGACNSFYIGVSRLDAIVDLIPPLVEPPCESDAACDDGDICNGIETCNLETGNCMDGPAPEPPVIEDGTFGFITVSSDARDAILTELPLDRRLEISIVTVHADGERATSATESTQLETLADPPQVIDLVAETISSSQIAPETITAGTTLNDGWTADQLFDGSTISGWSSARTPSPSPTTIVVEFDSPQWVSSIELLPSDAYPELFPKAIALYGKLGFAPRTLLEAANLRGSHFRSYFQDQQIDQLIIDITDMNRHVSGDYHAVLGEIIIRGGYERSDALMLHFTAPGDDPNYGKASHYEVRWSETPFPARDAAFEGLSNLHIFEETKAAGEPEAIELSGLAGDTRYYIGLVAVDRHGNRSALSNLTTAKTPIGSPPIVSDLSARRSVDDWSTTLSFTAPRDRRGNAPSGYDVRFSDRPIERSNFGLATPIAAPDPGIPGTTVSFEVPHEDANQAYFFAMKVVGQAGEVSKLSNLALSVPARPNDVTEPATSTLVGELLPPLITDPPLKLSASTLDDLDALSDGDSQTDLAFEVTDGLSVVLEAEWETPRTLFDFILRRSVFETSARQLPSRVLVELSYDGQHYTTLTAQTLDTHASEGRFQLGNHLAKKLRVTFMEDPGSQVQFHVLGELEFRSLSGDHQALLSWIAPGDDLYTGRASEYELRMGDFDALTSSFNNGSRVFIQSPSTAGTLERTVIPSLPAESSLGFQLRTFDDQNVGSGLSNVLSLTTPIIPPAALERVSASANESGTLAVLSSSGYDDGQEGSASGYRCTLSGENTNLETVCGLAIDCPDCIPCALSVADDRIELTLSQVPNNQTFDLRCAAIDDHGAHGLFSPSITVRTFDTLAPDAATDFIAQTEFRLLIPESAALVQGQADNLEALIDANPYTVGTLRPSGDNSVVEMTIELPLQSSAISHLAIRSGNFTSLRLWDRVTGETLISEPRFVPSDEAGWTLLQFANANTQRLGLQLGTTTIDDDEGAFSGIQIADIGLLGPHAVVSFTAPFDPPYGVPLAGYALPWSTESTNGSVVWPRPPLPAGFVEESAIPMATFTDLPFDADVCLQVEAIDAGLNSTLSNNDSCIEFDREMVSRIEDLQIVADNDLTIAEANLSFTYSDLGELGGFDYFELRDFNISTDAEGRTLDQWSWSDATCIAKVFTVDSWSTSQGVVVQSCEESATLQFITDSCAIDNGSLSCTLRLDTAANDARETLATAIRVQNDSSGLKERSRLSNRVLFSRVAPPSEPISFEITNVTSRTIDFTFSSPTDYVLPRGGPASRYDLRWMEAPNAPVSNWDDLLLADGIELNTAAPSDPATPEMLSIRGPKPEQDVIFGIRWLNAEGTWSAMTVSPEATRMLVEPPANVGISCKQESPGQKGPLSHLEVRFAPVGQDGAAYDDGRTDLATEYEICVTRREVIPLPDGLGPENSSCQRISIGNGVGVRTTANAQDQDGDYTVYTELEVQVRSQPTLNTNGGSVFEAFEDGTQYQVSIRAFATSHRSGEEEVSVGASACTIETPDLTPAEPVDDLTILQPEVGAFRELVLELRAPHDPKSRSGQASKYEILLATTPEAAEAGRGSVYEVTPSPASAGTIQTISLGLEAGNSEVVLAPEQEYSIRIRTEDGNENISNWSNIATRRTLDEDPADIENLECEGSVENLGAICAWTAPGDDNLDGKVDRYEMRIWSDNPDNARVVQFTTEVSGGGADTVTIGDLDEASFYYFQLTAYDERNNSSVSNTTSLTTPIFPPAEVDDLSCERLAGILRCSLTAVGDDTMRGYAARYVVRNVSHAALEEAELTALCDADESGEVICGDDVFESALALGLVQELNTLGLPPPTYPGYPQVLDLSMFLFTPEERHYIRIDTVDDIDALGPSNVVSFRSEGVPPNDPAITLCQPLVEDGALIGLDLIFRPAGDDGAEGEAEEHLLRWGLTSQVDAETLLSTGTLVEGPLPAGGGNLKFRLNADDAENPLNEAQELLFGVIAYDDWGYRSPFNAIARTACWTPDLTPPQPITDLNLSQGAEAGSFGVAFSAPTDTVGRTGSPERYQIAYRSALPNESCDELLALNSFEIVDLAIAPAPPGNPHVFNVGAGSDVALSIENETRYCFAIRSIDAEDNVSEWSNTASETSPVVPPGAIADLSCAYLAERAEIECSFLGTGNDGATGGAPLGYRAHVDAADGTSRVFDFVDDIQGPGLSQTVSFAVVAEGLEHQIKVQAFDQASFGQLSDEVQVDVPAISPSAIEDLICSVGEVMDDRPIICTFTESGDDGDEGCLTELLIYTWIGNDEIPGTCTNPQTCILETINASETCAGTPRSVDLPRFNEGATQRVALVTVDDNPLSEDPESNHSTVTIPLIPPAAFELSCEADPADAPRIDCSFTEPGDDENSGTVTSYQIRYATTPLTEENFLAATIVNTTLFPQGAGSVQTFSFSPDDGRSYSIGVKAIDDRNQSSLATTGQAVSVADITPPASVGQVDVSATEQRGELRLVFLPSGDDGNDGEASAYRVALSTTVFQSNADVSIEPGCIGEGDAAICTFNLDPVARQDGKLETTLKGLLDETEYFLVVFAIDDEGNRGPSPSNASSWTLDVPPTVEDPILSEDVNARGLAITYVAPGDNELSGADVTTELRWGYAPANSTDCLIGSVEANTEILPNVEPGTHTTFSLTNLETDRRICVQLVATDSRPNTTSSSIKDAYLDTVPPTAIQNPTITSTLVPTELQLEFDKPDATAIPNVLTTFYAITKPQDVDEQPIGDDEVSCSRGSLCQIGQGLDFIELTALQTTAQGRIQGLLVGLKAETAYHIAIVAIDEDENVGELPPSTSTSTPRVAPGAFTLAPGEVTATTTELIFLAPGDDNGQGFAERYEFYHHPGQADDNGLYTCPGDTNAYNLILTHESPLEGGQRETLLLSDLAPNAGHCVFMVAFDDYRSPDFPEGQSSTSENTVLFKTADPTAPAQILDVITEPGDGTDDLQIRFTSVGDDEMEGEAAYYEVITLTEAEFNSNGAPELGSVGTRFSDPAPKVAGSQEILGVSGLLPETNYVVFVRAVDEESNRGSWSPASFGSTAPVAPSPPTALSCTAALESNQPALDCEVTEPGDEGNQGSEAVAALEVYLSVESIDDAALDELDSLAIQFNPVSRLAGQITRFTLSGLEQNTTYSIAVRAVDDFGLVSLGAFTVATTLDLTPPGEVSSFEAVAASLEVRPLRSLSTAASSQLSEGWSSDLVTDLSIDTSWVSAPRELQGEEWIALTLPEGSLIERASFSVDAEFIDVFPATWRIDASQDGTEWTTVVSGIKEGILPDNTYEFGFPPQSATLVRMVAENAGIRDDKVFTALSELGVERPKPSSAEVVLSLSPPGDDGLTGGLNELEFFWSTSALLVNGEEVVTADGSDVHASQKAGPFIPGSLVLHRLSGLPGESRIYIGARGRDEAGLIGGLATTEVLTVPIAPAPVTVQGIVQTEGALTLQFTESGDDGLTGEAETYLVTFSDTVIDLSTNTNPDWEWELDTNSVGDSTLEAVFNTDIMPDGLYAVQVVALDDDGHRSYPSGATMVQLGVEEDDEAPACITGLQGILTAESGTLAPLTTIQMATDGSTYSELNSTDTLALTDGDAGTVYSYAQETDSLFLKLTLASETRIAKVSLDQISGFEAYLADVIRAQCDDSVGPAELQALEPTSTESGIELIPTTQGLKCSTITIELELPRLAEHHVLGLADLSVTRAPYPSGTVTLSWLGTGDDGTNGVASSQSISASCNGLASVDLDALVITAPSGYLAPERVVIPGDYLMSALPCETNTQLSVSTCDDANNCSQSAINVDWNEASITGIETNTCPAP